MAVANLINTIPDGTTLLKSGNTESISKQNLFSRVSRFSLTPSDITSLNATPYLCVSTANLPDSTYTLVPTLFVITKVTETTPYTAGGNTFLIWSSGGNSDQISATISASALINLPVLSSLFINCLGCQSNLPGAVDSSFYPNKGIYLYNSGSEFATGNSVFVCDILYGAFNF